MSTVKESQAKLGKLSDSLMNEVSVTFVSNVEEFGKKGIISDIGLKCFELDRAVNTENFKQVPALLKDLQDQLPKEKLRDGKSTEGVNKIIGEMKATCQHILTPEKALDQNPDKSLLQSPPSQLVKKSSVEFSILPPERPSLQKTQNVPGGLAQRVLEERKKSAAMKKEGGREM